MGLNPWIGNKKPDLQPNQTAFFQRGNSQFFFVTMFVGPVFKNE
jgi:hypothetical protein